MDKLPLTSNNCLYICYCCLNYKTTKRCDMVKHLEKKKKCTLTYIPKKMYSFEEFSELSLNNRFYFLFDYRSLLFQDYIYIIHNFNEKINYIKYEDIVKNKSYLSNFLENELKNNKSYDKIINSDFLENEIKDNKLINNNKKENDECYVVIENNVKLFGCMKCHKKYKYKKDLVNHLKNKSICENNQLLNNMINDCNNKSIVEIVEDSKKLQQNIVNSFNNNNLNVQNNYNNAPTIKLEVNDFGRETYSYNHIPKSFIKQDDFYLYKNFLNKLLENKDNQNIYFMNYDEDIKAENRKAIVYADEILYKINEDKAIFMMLEKLKNTMDSILLSKKYTNSLIENSADSEEENKKLEEKIAEIKKYYHVVSGHFKHDTIFKDYDLKEKQFYNLAHKRRSRDIYTLNIKDIVNEHGTPISELNNNNLVQQLHNFSPDIEDYASTRLRNKDLKKRKDELTY